MEKKTFNYTNVYKDFKKYKILSCYGVIIVGQIEISCSAFITIIKYNNLIYYGSKSNYN